MSELNYCVGMQSEQFESNTSDHSLLQTILLFCPSFISKTDLRFKSARGFNRSCETADVDDHGGDGHPEYQTARNGHTDLSHIPH